MADTGGPLTSTRHQMTSTLMPRCGPRVNDLGEDPDADGIPASHYPLRSWVQIHEPAVLSAALTTPPGTTARCPAGCPTTVIAILKLVQCLPDCCDYMSPPCSSSLSGTHDDAMSTANHCTDLGDTSPPKKDLERDPDAVASRWTPTHHLKTPTQMTSVRTPKQLATQPAHRRGNMSPPSSLPEDSTVTAQRYLTAISIKTAVRITQFLYSYPRPIWGGIVFAKLWLIFSWRSSSTIFTFTLILTSVLHLKDRRQSN